MNAALGRSFEEQVAPIFRATTIESAESCRLLGRPFPLPAAPVDRLQVLLYEKFYCRSPPAPQAPDAKFTRQLVTAAARAGSRTRASLADQQGFLYVHGTRYEGDWENDAVLRFYFHLQPPEVLRLFATLPALLEKFQIPFHLKTLLQPAALERRSDGTVLFLQKHHFPVAAQFCLELMATFSEPAMPRQNPLLTLALAPGLGMAEDPGTSFGMSRCRLLAEALWKAFKERISAVEEQVEAAHRLFVERGLDPERPYLNPGSAGYYPLPSPLQGPGL